MADDRDALPAALLDAVADVVGAPLDAVATTVRGESRSTFRISAAARQMIVKVLPDGPPVLDNQRRLARLVNDLAQRGYPAPVYLGVGKAAGHVFTVQTLLAGELLDAGPGLAPPAPMLAEIVPALLQAVELQADAGDLAVPPWPAWLLDTIDRGGDGYCLHETMRRRPDTSALLDRLIALSLTARERGPSRDRDIVHFDLNPANILHRNGTLTGVVDWNVPFSGAMQGDRGFDIATFLFYCYDVSDVRSALWTRATAISGRSWTTVYLCHLVLRQVEWTVRHRPDSEEERRFLAIASAALDDCAQGAGGY